MKFILIISIIEVALSMPRMQNRPVQVYSKTGQFMTIRNSGRIAPARKRSSILSLIQKESVGVNQFSIRGVSTGLYAKINNHGKLRTVAHKNQATKFSEELLDENNFISFRLADKPKCHLKVSKNSYKVTCKSWEIEKISFLSRRAHLPSHVNVGHHF